jgi:hypothetical protein
MLFSFGQGDFNQPAHSRRRSAFFFQKPQAVPQPDDYSLFPGVHASLEQKGNDVASRYG